MEQIKPILGIVVRVLFILVIAGTTMISLATGYIMFAPDSFPKPFRLVFSYPGSDGIPVAGMSCVDICACNCGSVVAGGSSDDHDGSSGGSTSGYHPGYGFLPGRGIKIDTGSKIINLSDGRRLIRVNIVLEFEPSDINAYENYLEELEAAASGEEEGGGHGGEEGGATVDYLTQFEEEIDARMPAIDDAIISVISQHTFEDLYTTEGKEALREEIMEKVNESVPDERVIAVYFSEFVIE